MKKSLTILIAGILLVFIFGSLAFFYYSKQPRYSQKYLSDPSILDKCPVDKRSFRVCVLKDKELIPYNPNLEKLKPGDFVLVKFRPDVVIYQRFADEVDLNKNFQLCSYTSLIPSSTLTFSQQYSDSVLFQFSQLEPRKIYFTCSKAINWKNKTEIAMGTVPSDNNLILMGVRVFPDKEIKDAKDYILYRRFRSINIFTLRYNLK